MMVIERREKDINRIGKRRQAQNWEAESTRCACRGASRMVWLENETPEEITESDFYSQVPLRTL